MGGLLDAILYVVSFLAMLSILVFVHEWGHFIIARLNGVRVDVFSIGFGPEIWGRTDKKGTRWKISYIPLGGYVKFFGDDNEASAPDSDFENLAEEDKKVSFHHKKLHQRTAIVLAGPIANFIFSILIIATFYYINGQIINPAVVSELVPGGVAEEAGMQQGDIIIKVDDSEIKRFKDLRIMVYNSSGETLNVEVLRDAKKKNFILTPRLRKTIIDGVPFDEYYIGVISSEEIKFVEIGIAESLWQGTLETKMIVVQSLRSIRQMIVGTRSVKELSGPIGIAKIAGESVKRGIDYWVRVMALVSISLGMINLFPIPLLDGGHLVFYMFEAVLGRKLSVKTQEFAFQIGLVFILGLMILATFNDILKFSW